MKEEITLHVPVGKNTLLSKVQQEIQKNKEIVSLWKVMNVNAIERLEMTDHGPVHFQIVANIALRLARILKKNGVDLSIVKDFKLTQDHGEVVIFLASIMHDLGISIEREGHEEMSLFLANTLLREILGFMPMEEKTIVISETLHAIISHRKNGRPLTLEAGIVRVADALDMTAGRSRVPYLAGDAQIHTISHAGIESVEINEGKEKPIEIIINMNNASGVFQVDELLKNKLKGSGLEKYVSIKARLDKDKEKSLIDEININI